MSGPKGLSDGVSAANESAETLRKTSGMAPYQYQLFFGLAGYPVSFILFGVLFLFSVSTYVYILPVLFFIASSWLVYVGHREAQNQHEINTRSNKAQAEIREREAERKEHEVAKEEATAEKRIHEARAMKAWADWLEDEPATMKRRAQRPGVEHIGQNNARSSEEERETTTGASEVAAEPPKEREQEVSKE